MVREKESVEWLISCSQLQLKTLLVFAKGISCWKMSVGVQGKMFSREPPVTVASEIAQMTQIFTVRSFQKGRFFINAVNILFNKDLPT